MPAQEPMVALSFSNAFGPTNGAQGFGVQV
jgi:hypothetical protein